MNTAVIKLIQLGCYIQQEENGDEVYIEFTVDYEGEKSIKDRVPSDKSKTWDFKNGVILNEVQDLFSGLVTSKFTANFKFMEQDTFGRISKRNILDDNVGEFGITVYPDGKTIWKVSENTTYKASEVPHQYSLLMKGAGAEYHAEIYFRLI